MKRHYRHMTPAKAELICKEYFTKPADGKRVRQWELAKKYGIKQNSVSRIISGQVW